MNKVLISMLVVLFILCGNACSQKGGGTMKITSPVFEQKGMIPKKYTCQGNDINPPLRISGIPENTKSLVLIVDDPDAPGGMWVHWVVFNIPVTEAIAEDSIPGVQGSNDFGRNTYGGPCPPSGTHRYFHKIYALDTQLQVSEGSSKGQVENAMKGHVLAEDALIGLYKKS